MSRDRRWAFEREDEDERLARVLDEEARDRLGLEEADRLLERADAPNGGSMSIPRCDGFNGVGCDRLATTRRGLCARCDTERLLMVTRRLAGLPSPPADLQPVRVVRFPRSFVRDDGDAAA